MKLLYKIIYLNKVRETGDLEISTFGESDFDGSEIEIHDMSIIKRKGNSVESYDFNGKLVSKFEQVQQISVLK